MSHIWIENCPKSDFLPQFVTSMPYLAPCGHSNTATPISILTPNWVLNQGIIHTKWFAWEFFISLCIHFISWLWQGEIIVLWRSTSFAYCHGYHSNHSPRNGNFQKFTSLFWIYDYILTNEPRLANPCVPYFNRNCPKSDFVPHFVTFHAKLSTLWP